MSVITIGGRTLEYTVVGDGHEVSSRRTVAFLHEGLGSLALWRGFPEEVARRSGRRCVVYSRPGCGWSSVIPPPWPTDYLDRAAAQLLELLARLGIERPVLVGHSDGASIAIIAAGCGGLAVEGLVFLAPHVFVEDRSLQGVELARARYLGMDLKRRMERYHRDPDATFWGWNGVWRSEAFRAWNIEPCLKGIASPVLLVQGADDDYGTLRQLDAVESGIVGPVERLVVDGCGHSPHLEAPEVTVDALMRFLARLP